MRFGDKVAVVTAGGAGIGKATALLMAHEGVAVTIVDSDAQRVEATVAELERAGARALGIACDAMDAEAVRAATLRTLDAFGRIDILVNGVGGSTIISNPAAAPMS